MKDREREQEPARAALPPTLRARVLSNAAKVPSPSANDRRALVRPVLLLAAAIAWVLLRAGLERVRGDWSALPITTSWVPLIEAIAVGGLVGALSLARGPAMVGPSQRGLWGALLAPIVITATVLALAVPTAATDAAALEAGGARFWPAIVSCGAEAVVIGLPVTLLLIGAQRSLLHASPMLVGAITGVAAASWAHAVLHWGCPIADIGHIIVGHAMPTVPLAIGGALVGWQVDRRRLRAGRTRLS